MLCLHHCVSLSQGRNVVIYTTALSTPRSPNMLDAFGVPTCVKLDRNSFSPRKYHHSWNHASLSLPFIEIQLHVFILRERRSPITVESIFGLKGPGLHSPKGLRSCIMTDTIVCTYARAILSVHYSNSHAQIVRRCSQSWQMILQIKLSMTRPCPQNDMRLSFELTCSL
jgi:hypothetical protein